MEPLNVTLETHHQFRLEGYFIKTSELLCPKYTHTLYFYLCEDIDEHNTLASPLQKSPPYPNPKLNLRVLKQSFEIVFIVFLSMWAGVI